MKTICSINGKVVPLSEAKLDLSRIETQYNFGVYETIKIRNSISYFIPQHINRLFHSADCINLVHQFTEEQIVSYIQQLTLSLNEPSCNLKVLLYGLTVYILPSTPKYPDRKWYKEGVSLKSFQHERWMPTAKTLNMLPSYYMYTQAKQNGHYDALLLDHKQNILEGTRTNAYLVRGNTLYSAPKDKILEGVTLMTLERIIKRTSFTIKYQDIPYSSLSEFDGMILTSTSSKILPVRQADSTRFEKISDKIIELGKIYDEAFKNCGGVFERL